ncbi:MAG: hypothetical protein WC503_02580 [Candidatus Shapirobacteria bacterium]
MDGEPTKKEVVNRPVKSFETAKGSTYTYDANGNTLRYKTVDQEWQEKMDITVFVPTDDENKAKIFDAYTRPNKFNFYLVEVQGDKQVPIYGLEDVTNPENLRFGVFNIPKNKWAFFRKASLTPTIGTIVYERGKSAKSNERFQHHLGHEVTKINY